MTVGVHLIREMNKSLGSTLVFPVLIGAWPLYIHLTFGAAESLRHREHQIGKGQPTLNFIFTFYFI